PSSRSMLCVCRGPVTSVGLPSFPTRRSSDLWVMRADPAIVFWEGETRRLGDGLTLIRCGGHFAGGTVLHWGDGADGRGVPAAAEDRKSTRLNSSHVKISYAVFCLKKKTNKNE